MAKTRMYQIIEAKDTIEKGIKAYQVAIDEHTIMIELIEASKRKDIKKLEETLKGLKQAKTEYERKLKTYQERWALADNLIQRYNRRDSESEIVNDVVTKVIEVLGCVAPEPSPEA